MIIYFEKNGKSTHQNRKASTKEDNQRQRKHRDRKAWYRVQKHAHVLQHRVHHLHPIKPPVEHPPPHHASGVMLCGGSHINHSTSVGAQPAEVAD